MYLINKKISCSIDGRLSSMALTGYSNRGRAVDSNKNSVLRDALPGTRIAPVADTAVDRRLLGFLHDVLLFHPLFE